MLVTQIVIISTVPTKWLLLRNNSNWNKIAEPDSAMHVFQLSMVKAGIPSENYIQINGNIKNG